MSATYGGDEVNALVIDIGTSWTKAGYAGEDSPDIYIPTNIGACIDEQKGTTRYITDKYASTVYQPNMEIMSPLTDGIVSNWDAYEHLLNHTLRNQLRIQDSGEHPILMTEQGHTPKQVRERIAEICFESHHVPAYYVAKSPVLSAFAAGKGSALVIECGAGSTSVSPVFEGYVLNKQCVTQPVAGEFLTYQTLLTFNWNRVEIVPPYLIHAKEIVSAGQPVSVTKKDLVGVTKSFHQNALLRSFDDFKHTIAAVSETTLNEQQTQSINDPSFTKSYEFACGYNNQFTLERLRIAEVLFQPSKYIISQSTMPGFEFVWPTEPVLSINEMIDQVLKAVDVDVRPGLLSNVVCTGGSAQMPGFSARIESEIKKLVPMAKVKVCTGSTAFSLPERKFGAWLGGSILGSIGTFHSLWVSKQEFEEVGKNIIERKCV